MGRVSDAKERLMRAVLDLIWEGSYGRTTIDQICDRSGVRKGSFYYFFESKSALAIAALEKEWQSRQPELDSIFSPLVPPLERLRRYCEYGHRFQVEVRSKCGRVLGCPLFSLGAEVSTLEDELRCKILKIFDCKLQYLESAIRDAHNAGLIHAPNPAAKARMLFDYYEGLLTRARIRNSLDGLLEESVESTLDLLGARRMEVEAATAAVTG